VVRGGAPRLLAHERGELGAGHPAVPVLVAGRGEPAAVHPAADGVRADPQQRGRLTDPEGRHGTHVTGPQMRGPDRSNLGVRESIRDFLLADASLRRGGAASAPFPAVWRGPLRVL